MSDLLKQFLAEWLEWAESGASGGFFRRDRGLCSQFENWMYSRRLPYSKADAEFDRLIELFIVDGFDDAYPFGGQKTYERERDDGEIHVNPQRLAWVRSKVKQCETV